MSTATNARRTTVMAGLMCLMCAGLTTGATLAVGLPAGAHHNAATHKKAAASAAPGSGLGGIEVTATSSAVKIPVYEHTDEDVQASIPYSTSTLGSGGAGSSTTTMLWPGSTGANAGSAIQLLGISEIPASVANMLNDPEIAKASSGAGSPTVSMSHPGVTMTATATSTHVHSKSAAGGDGIPLLGSVVGNTSAATKIAVTGPKQVVTSSFSSIHHISIDKLITIKSITTTLRAVTNGKTSHGTARTIVAGMTIAGIPVSIDNKGVHVIPSKGLAGLLSGTPLSSVPVIGGLTSPLGGVTSPLGGLTSPLSGLTSALPAPLSGVLGSSASSSNPLQTATTLVNTALAKAGIHLTMTKATKTIHKAHIKLNSSSLIVKLNNAKLKSEANDTGDLLILASANINAIASPGFPTGTINPVTPPSTPPAATTTGGSGGSTGTGGSVGTAGTPGTPAVPGTPGTVSTVPGAQSPETAAAPVQTALAGNPVSLPSAVSPVWVIVALVGAGLLAFALKQVPNKVLSATGTHCRIEEHP
jgi:hypothetical protein